MMVGHPLSIAPSLVFGNGMRISNEDSCVILNHYIMCKSDKKWCTTGSLMFRIEFYGFFYTTDERDTRDGSDTHGLLGYFPFN